MAIWFTSDTHFFHNKNFVYEPRGFTSVEEMNKERAHANHIDNQRERAITFHDKVVPLMEDIRSHVDDLEMVIDDQLWPLPKYRELLFIH